MIGNCPGRARPAGNGARNEHNWLSDEATSSSPVHGAASSRKGICAAGQCSCNHFVLRNRNFFTRRLALSAADARQLVKAIENNVEASCGAHALLEQQVLSLQLPFSSQTLAYMILLTTSISQARTHRSHLRDLKAQISRSNIIADAANEQTEALLLRQQVAFVSACHTTRCPL